MDKDLKNKTLAELEQLVVATGQKKYLAKYIFNFIHAKDVADVSQISTLSKDFREQLAGSGHYISQLKLVQTFTDPDGTIKYLFEPADGNRIETVLLFDDDRRTLCVSTQAGCAMDCVFCATAKLKLTRNLTAAEIVDQINIVQKEQGRITNVVYMGMGEPLNNYDAVLKSVRILNHPQGRNIGIRHLTVSTCGIVPGILKLADEDINPRLAISLNAPTDEIRSLIMPINKKYPLAELFKAIRVYQHKTRQRVTFEYVLIRDFNDKPEHVQTLIKRLSDISCNVNLIEYNPHPGCKLAASSKYTIDAFASQLMKAGIRTAMRFKRGQKIKAACGQLGADRLKPNSQITQ
jgi:23S rRNA (adenine2503-C2)-methyltransferase